MSPVALKAAIKLQSAMPPFLAVFLTAGVFCGGLLTPTGYAVWSLYNLPLVVVPRIFRMVSIVWFSPHHGGGSPGVDSLASRGKGI